MTTITFFFIFIPVLAIILLAVNLIFAPHNSYMEKDSVFECGFHSFLGQNRTQFSISFFIFALLFLLFDLEILLVYPYVVSSYSNSIYGLVIMLLFFLALTLGFVFELGKNALKIDSKQTIFFNKVLNTSSRYAKKEWFNKQNVFLKKYRRPLVIIIASIIAATTGLSLKYGLQYIFNLDLFSLDNLPLSFFTLFALNVYKLYLIDFLIYLLEKSSDLHMTGINISDSKSSKNITGINMLADNSNQSGSNSGGNNATSSQTPDNNSTVEEEPLSKEDAEEQKEYYSVAYNTLGISKEYLTPYELEVVEALERNKEYNRDAIMAALKDNIDTIKIRNEERGSGSTASTNTVSKRTFSDTVNENTSEYNTTPSSNKRGRNED